MSTISRQLSYILRHDPASAGVTLNGGGWVQIEVLSKAMGVPPGAIVAAAATNDKKRFTVKNGLIRACQGHSFPVDLGYEATRPPLMLYHGTHEAALESIRVSGLKAQSRQHVHLSENESTAARVGARRGKLVMLTVWASEMEMAGYKFYQADNGVWLTDEVPPRFLKFP